MKRRERVRQGFRVRILQERRNGNLPSPQVGKQSRPVEDAFKSGEVSYFEAVFIEDEIFDVKGRDPRTERIEGVVCKGALSFKRRLGTVRTVSFGNPDPWNQVDGIVDDLQMGVSKRSERRAIRSTEQIVFCLATASTATTDPTLAAYSTKRSKEVYRVSRFSGSAVSGW